MVMAYIDELNTMTEVTFDKILQAIDSTLIKANASMVSLRVNLKIAGQDNKLKNNSEEDNTNYDRDSETVSDLSITQDYSFL